MNTIITTEILAKELALHLKHQVQFPKLVHTDYSDEFVAGIGESVKVIKPATFIAQDFAGEVSPQGVNESSTVVRLDRIADVSLALTARDLTLKIEDLSDRILKPAAAAIAEKIDRDIAGMLINAPAFDTIVEGEFTRADLIDMRKKLNLVNAPASDRYVVASAVAEADLLGDELFISAEKVGDTAALREASLGRKFGFDIYNSNAVNGGMIGFHKHALAFVNRPLVAPSTAESYVWVEDGISIRITRQYDIKTKTEMFSVDCLYGLAFLNHDLVTQVTNIVGE